MAENQKQRDLLTRLSDAGEDALSRLAGSGATAKVVEGVGGMRERLDEVQKKMRGIDELEKRVAKLEKRLDDLAKPKPRARTTRSRSSGGATRTRKSGTTARSSDKPAES
jgi:hypothetical protein